MCKIRETINEQYHKLLMLNYLCHDNTQNVQYTHCRSMFERQRRQTFGHWQNWLPLYDVGSRTPASTVHQHLHNRFRLAVHTRRAESVRCVCVCENWQTHRYFLSIFKHSRKRCGTTIFGICNFFRCLHIEVNRFSIMALLSSDRCYCKIPNQ